jgi:hypothetical protein
MIPFSVPTTLTDLERKPYRLLPYPDDFDDRSEDARAESFIALVDLLKEGNYTLTRVDWTPDVSDQDDALHHNKSSRELSSSLWFCKERLQALYTLVRCVYPFRFCCH